MVAGSHDGVESWTVRVGPEGDAALSRVSPHEHRHHELHTTSPWGLLLVARSSDELGAPGDLVWQWLAQGCREVHEVFATYFWAHSTPGAEEVVSTSAEYLAYLQTGDALSRWLSPDAPARHLLVDGLLRAMMAPGWLADLSVSDIARLRLRDIPDTSLPDERLWVLRRLDGSPAFRAKAAALAVRATPEGAYAVFRDDLAELLTQNGIDTLTTDRHHGWADRVVGDLNGSAPLRTFELVVGAGDPVRSLLDDYQRERLRLHDAPLPLVAVSADDADFKVGWFARRHEELGVHAWLLWMRSDLMRRQFVVPADVELPAGRPAFGLLGADRRGGTAFARWWTVPLLSPQQLAEMLSTGFKDRLVFVTTLATVVDSPPETAFTGISPVFVIIDQSLLGFLDRTAEGGALLRWDIVRVGGDRDLRLFVMTQSALPDVYFLLFATEAARDALIAYLQAAHPDLVTHDPEVTDPCKAHLGAAVEHVVGTFWELDLFAGRVS